MVQQLRHIQVVKLVINKKKKKRLGWTEQNICHLQPLPRFVKMINLNYQINVQKM